MVRVEEERENMTQRKLDSETRLKICSEYYRKNKRRNSKSPSLITKGFYISLQIAQGYYAEIVLTLTQV